MTRQRLGDVVVLLPGILGSVLERDGKEVWAPTPGAALRALWTLGRSIAGLRLDDDPIDEDDLDGVVATRLMPDVHIVPGLWGIDGYSAISAMITSTFDVVPGETFVPFPYDWRRDNRVAARQLPRSPLAALHEQRKENADAKLVLIGHSMGGLVARYFLECLDGWKDTRMLITFGTPYRGSLNAVDFIANGFTKKVGPFKVADLSELLRSLTSVYQLLPIYPCIDEGTARSCGSPSRAASRTSTSTAPVPPSTTSTARSSTAVGGARRRTPYPIHPDRRADAAARSSRPRVSRQRDASSSQRPTRARTSTATAPCPASRRRRSSSTADARSRRVRARTPRARCRTP